MFSNEACILPFSCREDAGFVLSRTFCGGRRGACRLSNLFRVLKLPDARCTRQQLLAVLDGGKCILQLRGVRPFLSDKYDLTQHPNYKLTSDYDPKNTFDIEKYLNRKEKIHPGDEFIVVDADSLPSA